MKTNQTERTADLGDEVNLLRQEVVVLRESLDEFRDDLVHILRVIADRHLTDSFGYPRESDFGTLPSEFEAVASQSQDSQSAPTGHSQSVLF